MTITNEQTKFAGFIEEGMNYVNAWCATEINEGGCGYFAQILSKKLLDKGIDHKIIAVWYPNRKTGKMSSRDKESESNLREFVGNGKKSGNIGADHILVKVGDIYIDSTGIMNVAVMAAIDKMELTDEEVSRILDVVSWNPIFDKGCVPHMTKLMDEVWEKYDTFTSGCFKYPEWEEVRFTDHTISARRNADPLVNLESLLR